MSEHVTKDEWVSDLYTKLSDRIFTFGPASGSPLTNNFILRADGSIGGYSHANETSWGLKGRFLFIYNSLGEPMWLSKRLIERNDGVDEIILLNPGSGTKFIMKQDGEAATMNKDPEYFLYPKDLEISPSGISKVLLIGSCLTALYHEGFSSLYGDVSFDYIPYNFVSQLPEKLLSDVLSYDFQYVQLPLRSVLSDRVIWGLNFNDPTFSDAILDNAYNVIDAMLDTALAYNAKFGILTFVSNFIVPQRSTAPSLHDAFGKSDLCYLIHELNKYISNRIREYKNTYLLDVNHISSSLGKKFILDEIVYFYTHGGVLYQDWDDFGSIPRNEPIPPVETVYDIKKEEFLRGVFRGLESLYRTVKQIDQVKLVVFDLDNTLWRGQIAEDYRHEALPWPRRDGWPVGLWEAVHYLRARGILTALCSKNDYSLVRERWDDVVDPKFISLEDFACLKINWEPKAKNIEEICQEINVKPKSVVFVDDNPVERASVQAALPDVRVIGGNPYLTRRVLLWAPETQIAVMTSESGKREEMVRGQIRREEARNTLTREEFLESLACKVRFIEIMSPSQQEVSRTLELTNKTNQFNTNGKRWSFEELSQFIDGGGRIICLFVQDKFTEYGLVGVFYIKGRNIIQYVMSCRVLGMGVEEFSVSKIVSFIRGVEDEAVTATITQTKDNMPCRNLYTECGFSGIGCEGDTFTFILNKGVDGKCITHIEDMSS